jgi:hypothetical protein
MERTLIGSTLRVRYMKVRAPRRHALVVGFIGQIGRIGYAGN